MSNRYEPQSIEPKWQARWESADLFRTREDADRPKFYGLDFFPYPSGKGLSVGHLRNYIPTDVLCRMKYMQGFNVLHPMGWDAFGLPAESEAIKRQIHPAPMVKQYAATYRDQEKLVGISYDWHREINSSDPNYYKWTQWIFQILYRRGLAYHGDYPANWCPNDKTVLANEEVEGGLCWRCGTPVEKRILKQWFFKITDYAQRLLDDLDELDWPEGIKLAQRNWIGRSEGVEFEWQIEGFSEKVRVFTTRIDTVFGASFCVVSPEHPLVKKIATQEKKTEVESYVTSASKLSDQDRLATAREKTGVFTGTFAINPFNQKRTPIFVADYVLMNYGTGAIMAVPAHDDRDFEFAIKFGLEISQVIQPIENNQNELPFSSDNGFLINSEQFNNLSVSDAKQKMADWIEQNGLGIRKVNYRLRDWLISRQRYWGCPIPIIHTEDGMELVPESHLPIELPEVAHYEPTSTGESPLAGIPEWVNTIDSKGRPAKRETDTMGGFACSSWYFLRFCDPHNDSSAFDLEKAKYWMPVDCYVGGAEHAVMHLLYARFWTKVLYDEGLLPFKEPFKSLKNQGMLLAETYYRHPNANETLKVGEDGIQISQDELQNYPKDQIFVKWEKMSKSKGNVVTPTEGAQKYGADALRVYELFEAPFEQTIQWSVERVRGSINFLNRVFRLISEYQPYLVKDWKQGLDQEFQKPELELRNSTHKTIQKVTGDIEKFKFNTAVSALMEFLNVISDFTKTADFALKSTQICFSEAIENLILLLAPIAPHSADEIWESIGHTGFTYLQEWPIPDAKMLIANTVTYPIQVNGKVRATIDVPRETSNDELEKFALAEPKVQQFIQGLTVKKVIIIAERLINVVAN